MKIQAIIPAAGAGLRLRARQSKPLILLGTKPMIVYPLEVFQKCPLIKSIIVVAPKGKLTEFKKIIQKYRLIKVTRIIAGGPTRRDSVRCGLKALNDDTEYVIIHDGARPFLTTKILNQTIAALKNREAVAVGVEAKSTIKVVDPKTFFVKKTLPRQSLWEIQTPQGFRRQVICRAHRRAAGRQATDDAMLVEQLGIKVKIIPGDYRNIKITTEDDVVLAKTLLASLKR